jgi:hypothetical protein
MPNAQTSVTLPAAVGNMGTPSTYGGSASNNSATSHDRAATVNSTTVVGASTAILIVRITIAATVVTAAHNCCAANDCSPSNDCSTSISGTMPNCGAPVDAAASDGSSLSLQSLAVIYRNIFVLKDRIRRTHCRQDK